MLEYMYLGEATIKQERMNRLLDLAESIEELGGYHSDVFEGDDIGSKLAKINNRLSYDKLNIESAQAKLKCLKIAKVEELVVNENSNMRDLNIAVLMTHWDYIGPVYFHRY